MARPGSRLRKSLNLRGLLLPGRLLWRLLLLLGVVALLLFFKDGRAAEDSSLSDAAGYAANLSASSGSVFQHELDYGYREELQSAAYTGRGSVNFSAGLPTGILLPFFLSARFWRDFSAHILPAMTAIFLVLLKT